MITKFLTILLLISITVLILAALPICFIVDSIKGDRDYTFADELDWVHSGFIDAFYDILRGD